MTFALTVPHGRELKQEAANRSEIQRNNAEYRIKWVCSVPKADPNCVAETRQAEAENRRNEEDLGAQKVSAWWAQVMGVAALIGMMLSVVGVILVWITFQATRHSNDIANAALDDARTLAEPTVLIEGNFLLGDMGQQRDRRISVSVNNQGPSRIFDVRVRLQMKIPGYGPPTPIELKHPAGNETATIVVGRSHGFYFSLESIALPREEIVRLGGGHAQFTIQWSYRNEFGQERNKEGDFIAIMSAQGGETQVHGGPSVHTATIHTDLIRVTTDKS